MCCGIYYALNNRNTLDNVFCHRTEELKKYGSLIRLCTPADCLTWKKKRTYIYVFALLVFICMSHLGSFLILFLYIVLCKYELSDDATCNIKSSYHAADVDDCLMIH